MDVLFVGAHPDDFEVGMGGTAARMAQVGHRVHVVSVTDGCRGHFEPQYVRNPRALVERRQKEAYEAATYIGATYRTMGIPDGEVYVTQDHTEAMVRLLRSYGESGHGPDAVFLNRPNDYHRDHRYTARLVLDATYMLTVPGMCPDAPHLSRMPAFFYTEDRFTEGGEFRADMVVDITDAVEIKTRMAACHVSQFFEWLPFNDGTLDTIPPDQAGRLELLNRKFRDRGAKTAARWNFAGSLAEAFQVSEYGTQPDADGLNRIFGV